jgi:parallel beta-helix repeat protein
MLNKYLGSIYFRRTAIRAIFSLAVSCFVLSFVVPFISASAGTLVNGGVAQRSELQSSDAQPGCCEGNLPKSVYVSVKGDDAHDGRTINSPLRTISEAMKNARAGTVINIEGGTYFEQIRTEFAGEKGDEIILTSYNGTATIDGSKLNWRPGSDQNEGLVELRHPFVILRNLRIANSKNTGVLLAADNLRVENCEIVNTQRHGISTDTRRQTGYPGSKATMIKNLTVEGNTVDSTVLKGRGFGQGISIIADGFQVTRNTVRNTLAEGIDIWLGSKNGDVADNIVHHNLRPGIYIDGASDVRIHGNRVFNNLKGIGVSSEDAFYSTARIRVDNNLVYDNTEAGLFIWDSPTSRGFPGSQNVVFEKNTIVNNRISIYLSGARNSAEIINNTGYSIDANIFNSSTESSYDIRNNVWVDSLAAFPKDYLK